MPLPYAAHAAGDPAGSLGGKLQHRLVTRMMLEHRLAESVLVKSEKAPARSPTPSEQAAMVDRDQIEALEEAVACPPAALSCPFHADFGIMDQPGRALVCRARQKAAPSRCSYPCQATRNRYPRLHRSPQPKSKALQMDQICRPNSGFSETLLPQSAADIMRRTLDLRD